jgi:glucose-1-phosphate adenylyltransferase
MAAKTLAMVLAGGEGKRLDPLTRDRAKPAVPFGGRYRIIDFVLSNFANSGVLRMKVLTQYKSDSLNTHVMRAWRLAPILNQYVDLVPAQMRTGPEWYKGSADAIFQNINLITVEDPDHVFVFGSDNIYRMDVQQMLEFHQDSGAECTLAAIPMPIGECSQFGVVEVNESGQMIGFEEKPKNPKHMPGNPAMGLCSMGNYLFRTDALVREVTRDAALDGSAHDFGKSILTHMYKDHPVYVYDFARNKVPGQGERERGYWRDVGTIETYYQVNMDLVDVDPVFNLYNEAWPIYTMAPNAPPAKFVFNDAPNRRVGTATDTLVSEGCIISGGSVHRSVLSPKVRVNSYSTIEDSILFEGVIVGRHCRIKRAIIDKNVEIPPGTVIGHDPVQDKKRFHITESGLVVIPKGMRLGR